MKTHRSSWHVIMRTCGLRSARREPSMRTVHVRVVRGILALALALGSLGAAVVALPGHGSTGRVPASSHHPANSPAGSTGAHSTNASQMVPRPWMY